MYLCNKFLPKIKYYHFLPSIHPSIHLSNRPTNSMLQNTSLEANSHSATQEIPHLLWYVKIYYHICKCPPLVPILRQMHPVHTLPPYFPKIHSNIIFPSMPRSSKWSFPSGFLAKILYALLISPIPSNMPHTSHPP